MKIYIALLSFALLLWSGSESFSQEQLTIEDALRISVENNLGLQIARKSEEIARNNVTRGASGQLPSIGLNSNASYRVQNTMIEFSSPGIEPVDVNGAGSFLFNATLDANFVVFSGFRNQYRYDLLEANSRQSSLETRVRLENIVYQVLMQYAGIQSAEAMEKTAEEAVNVSLERYKRTEEALRLGTGTSLTVLEAEVALQQDSVRLAAAMQATRVQKRSLNRLLQRDPDIDFSVQQDIELTTGVDLETLEKNALAGNSQLAVARQQVVRADLSEKIARASLWPTVIANASYGYTRQDNDAGLILSQSTLGPVGGISLNFPLYDGGLRNRDIENARINQESSQLALTDQELQIKTELANAYDQYQLAMEQIRRESLNIELATKVLERTTRLIELGQATQLDFRTAQLNLQRARDVLVSYSLSARQAELELMRLSGTLVK